MTKQEWQEHYATAGQHDTRDCPQCAARRKTKEHNRSARVRRSVYADLGMVRVRGNLGGVYYE